MTERRDARFAWLRAGALGCSIAAATLAVTSCAGAPSTSPVSTAGAPVHSGQAGDRARAVRVRMVAVRDTFAACEQRLEAARGGLPTMAVVGASYTAGVGPDKPALSWAADLARNLRWDAVIYGVSGAGYVQTGTYGAGPMARQLGAEQLPGLSPSLVIVQAGYDDVQVPPGLERQQVDRTIKLIRTEAPHAAIGLVTVFASTARPIPAGFYHIDATIVAAARAADPNAIIMDPLAGQWTYQHAHHGLHPTVAGDAWIAGKVGAILHAHGIASHPGGTAPIICDAGVAGSISAPDSDPRA